MPVYVVVRRGNGSNGTVQVTAVEKLLTATAEGAGHLPRNWYSNVLCTHPDLCTPRGREFQSHAYNVLVGVYVRSAVSAIQQDYACTLEALFHTKLHRCNSHHAVGSEQAERVMR